ncbi:unnamed protein product [Cuscuta campestris]|uniref:Uncharacterized protein n=1 Tax=Cuscuta campestris TaxID=132261 RepID=A0A484LWQ2_9ASTE|nr:unnamed protein product [Cuscuta campestris]
MKVGGANIHFKKLEAKCSSPAFYEAYLEMIEAQELSEFLHMEIRFKESSDAEDEGSSDNVLIVSLKKSSKRKQVVSSSPSAWEPHTLTVVNLDEEEEVSAQGELRKKKKRRISSPSTFGNANPENSVQNQPQESPQDLNEKIYQDHNLLSPPSQALADKVDKFMQLYYVWRAWKVGNSTDQLLEWDQQLKNEKIIKRCLGLPINCHCKQILDEQWVWQKINEDVLLEHLSTSPASEFEVDDDYVAVYTPMFVNSASNQTADQAENITAEAQADLEAEAEDFQVFPESSTAIETVPAETILEHVATSQQQEQNYTTSEEELIQSLQFQVHDIITTTYEMPESWTRKVQGLIESALESQKATFRQDLEKVEMRHSQILEKTEEKYSSNLKEISQSVDKTLEIISLLSNSVSNTMIAYASDCQLQLKEAMVIKQQIAIVTTTLQKQMSFLQMDIRSALAVSSANQVITQDYLKVLADNQKEAFKLFKHFGTFTAKHKLEVIVQHKSLPPIPRLPIQAKEGELGYIPTHLNMTELILEAQQSNPENSVQHLSNNEFDGTEGLGTIASLFTNEAQQKERYNNLKRIKEECGVMQGIGEAVGSSKRKRS